VERKVCLVRTDSLASPDKWDPGDLLEMMDDPVLLVILVHLVLQVLQQTALHTDRIGEDGSQDLKDRIH